MADLMQCKPSPDNCSGKPNEEINTQSKNAASPACNSAAQFAEAAESSHPPSIESDRPPKRAGKETHYGRWETRYKELVAYKREHGDAYVPSVYEPNPTLGSWVGRQRTMLKQNRLSPERIRRLRKLGFVFSVGWDARYEQLAAYFREYGDTNVSVAYDRNPALGGWVKTQRAFFKQNQLSEERIDGLRKLGFEFALRVPKRSLGWDGRYEELAAYAQKHGNANVSRGYDQNPSLGEWVQTQRAMLKQDKLSQDRIGRLCELGFEFSLRVREQSVGWDERFAELAEYATEHGDANVPRNYYQNPALGTWVQNQRQLAKQNKLSQEQISHLCRIEFEFSLLERPGWDARYAELVAYVTEHNNSNVPRQYKPNPALGGWVDRQRTMRKENKLSQERIDNLRKLDFVFP